MSRNFGSRNIGQLVRPLLQPVAERFGPAGFALFTEWPAIVGEDFARRCRPLRLEADKGRGRSRGGGKTTSGTRSSSAASARRGKDSSGENGRVLVLGCDSAEALALSMDSGLIMERINRHFGYSAIARLQFVHGMAPSPENLPGQKTGEASGTEKRLEGALAENILQVEDPDMRKVLTSLALAISEASEGST